MISEHGMTILTARKWKEFIPLRCQERVCGWAEDLRRVDSISILICQVRLLRNTLHAHRCHKIGVTLGRGFHHDLLDDSLRMMTTSRVAHLRNRPYHGDQAHGGNLLWLVVCKLVGDAIVMTEQFCGGNTGPFGVFNCLMLGLLD